MRSATLPGLALLVVAALTGCTPGALTPTPEPSSTPPTTAAPSATPTPITADGRIALPYQGLVTVLLDPATGETERIEASANSHQHGTATAPDGTLVTAGTGAFGTATGGPNVAFLDPATGDEQVIALERPHETVAIWQPAADSGWQAVLAGGFTRDGWWDGLTIVDPASGETRELPLMGRPQHVIAAELPAD